VAAYTSSLPFGVCMLHFGSRPVVVVVVVVAVVVVVVALLEEVNIQRVGRFT